MEGLLTVGHCFPYCFLEVLWGDKALMEGNRVTMGDPPVPHYWGKPWYYISIQNLLMSFTKATSLGKIRLAKAQGLSSSSYSFIIADLFFH